MQAEPQRSPMAILGVLLALGIAPTLGMSVAGGWGAAIAFVAAATIVVSRALARTQHALREREVPLAGLGGAQALAMMDATRGRAPTDSALARVEALRAMAKHDPERARREFAAAIEAPGNNLAALVAYTDLAFELGWADAHERWAQTIAGALDRGINRLAAITFARHSAHRETLDLDPRYGASLAAALTANGEPDHALWVRRWSAEARKRAETW
jgi:hypothetical protein